MLHRPIIILLFSFAIISCNNSETTESTGDTTGVSDTEIVLGAFGPMTGPAALWGTIIKGTDSYFKMINEEGGIHGRTIKFVFKDDAYDPSKTVPAVRELVQRDEIFAMAGGIGTATSMSVVNFLEENNVPWITPMTGATHWTQPTKKNIYTSFPLYFDEGKIMADYAIDNLKSSKIAIIYQNDDFGKSGLVGAKQVLAENNMEFVAALPVEITDTDLSSHIAKLKESGAETVFLWVLPRQAAIVLGSSAVVSFKPNWIASIVLSDMTLMHNITKGLWEGVYFNYPMGEMIIEPNNELLKKYKAAFQKYYPEERWSTFAAAGFMWVEPLVEGLQRNGRALTRESFLETMQGIENYIGSSGIPISFSEDNHLGTRALCIMRCKSASEAERLSDVITSDSDLHGLIEMLELD